MHDPRLAFHSSHIKHEDYSETLLIAEANSRPYQTSMVELSRANSQWSLPFTVSHKSSIIDI